MIFAFGFLTKFKNKNSGSTKKYLEKAVQREIILINPLNFAIYQKRSKYTTETKAATNSHNSAESSFFCMGSVDKSVNTTRVALLRNNVMFLDNHFCILVLQD